MADITLPPELAAFAPHLQVEPDGCWTWTGNLVRGYALVRVAGRRTSSLHRWAYSVIVGDIPAGLDLDHLCGNRACCNPQHLEPVTRRVNLLRGQTIAARNAAKTACVHGHEFTPENVRIRPNGSRACADHAPTPGASGTALAATTKSRPHTQGSPARAITSTDPTEPSEPCQHPLAWRQTMDVIVTLGEEPTVTITEVHPVALADAIRYAIDATVNLAQRLHDTSDT